MSRAWGAWVEGFGSLTANVPRLCLRNQGLVLGQVGLGQHQGGWWRGEGRELPGVGAFCEAKLGHRRAYTAKGLCQVRTLTFR